jgi:hypothetical protein
VRSTLIVILLVRTQQIAQVPFAKNNDMVESLLSDGADQPLRASVLPRRTSRDRPIADAHGTNAPDEVAPLNTVAIPHHIARCFAPAQRLGELPSDPLGGWMGGNRHPKQISPGVLQNQQPVQQLKRDRRHHE